MKRFTFEVVSTYEYSVLESKDIIVELHDKYLRAYYSCLARVLDDIGQEIDKQFDNTITIMRESICFLEIYYSMRDDVYVVDIRTAGAGCFSIIFKERPSAVDFNREVVKWILA